MISPFEIRHTPANRAKTLPAHWDIHVNGCDDSIITVWDSEEMAQECIRFLEEYPNRSKFKNQAPEVPR